MKKNYTSRVKYLKTRKWRFEISGLEFYGLSMYCFSLNEKHVWILKKICFKIHILNALSHVKLLYIELWLHKQILQYIKSIKLCIPKSESSDKIFWTLIAFGSQCIIEILRTIFDDMIVLFKSMILCLPIPPFLNAIKG